MKKKVIHKSAKTGEFVSASEAEANPNESYALKVKQGGRRKKPSPDAAGFDLNAALDAISDRAEEKAEETEREQAEFRESAASAINPNSAGQRIGRASGQEDSLLEQIVLTAQSEYSPLKKNRLYNLLNRLSEVLAEQGKYAEAIEVCPETVRREQYQKILDAMSRPDSDECDCLAERLIDGKNRQTLELNSETPVLEVVTPEGEIKKLYQCGCGFMNAR